MKIGRCFNDFDGDIAVYKKLADLGYEYLEVPLYAAAEFKRERLAKIKETAFCAEVPITSSNMFFPGSLALLGDGFNKKAVLEYTKKALQAAAFLGIKTAVLGSGGVRRKPDDMPQDEAAEKLALIFKKVAEIAEKHEIVIALEPLNSDESNTITSCREGMEMIERVNHPNFKFLLDLYHMHKSGETAEDIISVAPVLRHCHIAAVPDRGFPSQERFDCYAGFLETLRNIRYTGDVTVESSFDGEAEANGVWHIRRWAENSGQWLVDSGQ